ncbi:MAG: hypothetical protein ABS95_00430 [Verrucomicrobia bacterium SCN 57-15]|nr:MAG: hypothetical protein ABS95_00430 [Verrucomicrobia bacterium SCN 57-15]
MSNQTKPACYGEMFPDLSRLNINRATDGKAFSVFVEKIGCGVQRRELHVKREEWDKCEECPSFDGCYHLSAAKSWLWQGLLAAA